MFAFNYMHKSILLNSSSSTILCKCNSSNIRRGTTLHNTVESEWAVHPEYFR